MNRERFVNTAENLQEIGDDFVFEVGQIFRDKDFNDEYIAILEVGPQVNAIADGVLEENGEPQYTVKCFNCNSLGRLFLVNWDGCTTSEIFTSYKQLKEYYFYTGKIAPAACLDVYEKCDKNDHIGRTQATNPLIGMIHRPPKKRPIKLTEEEMRKYEARIKAREQMMLSSDTSSTCMSNGASDNSTMSIFYFS